MYGTPPGIPGLVQTNITNSAEEKWALLDKDIEMVFYPLLNNFNIYY